MAAGQITYAPNHVILPAGALGQGAPLPDGAPSLTYLGRGVLDPRVPYSPASAKAGLQGFFANGFSKTLGQAPSTISTSNIAAAAHVVGGTPMTLVSTTGAGITVLATPFYCFGSGNTIPTGSLAIDGLPTYVPFGSSFITNFYNPASALGRAVSITIAGSASANTVTIKGADVYGYPMSQAVTTAASETVNTLKAFKFIYSVTATTTDAHNYSIGTADIFGMPIISNKFADMLCYWNNVLQVASAIYVAPDATNPATVSTGDVRGTMGPFGSASNGTIVLEALQTFTLGMMSSTQGVAIGMFGQTQV